MTTAITHDIELSATGELVPGLTKSKYSESSESLAEPPRSTFTVENPGGVEAHLLANGKEYYVRRNNQRRFHGIIVSPEPRQEVNRGSVVEVQGIQLGYKLLQARQCDSYDFDEDGDPATTRDGVTINPWRYFAFRDPDGALDANGNTPAIHGVNFADVFRCLIGTKFIHQIDFQDNSYLLASQWADQANGVQVYRDGRTGDRRGWLQRVRDGDGFAAGDTIETIELMNGDPNIDVMGDVSTVKVVLIGDYDGSNDVQVRACRNAGEGSRTYSSITLTRTDSFAGTSLAKWEGTVDLSSDGVTQKNRVGLEFTVPGSAGDSATTKIAYCYVEAVTVSDTGITEGTIETYSNPVTFADDSENYFDGDLLGFNRLDAAERVRKLTESDGAVNPSPHWDAWIDHTEQFHFEERRGEDKSNLEYSFEQGNLRVISHEYYGDELAFQTIALGAGSGTAQTRIVSKADFDTGGGLYDSDRDPANGASKDHRVMKFVDGNETSATNLLRKARAFHKLHRDPQEHFNVELEAEYVPYFNVGDSIPVKNIPTRTNEPLRVVRLQRDWQPNQGEDISAEIGQHREGFAQRLRGASGKADTITIRPQPAKQTLGLSGNGIPFDKNHLGKYAFSIPDGSLVDRVFLRMETLPYQAPAKSISTSAAGSQEGQATSQIAWDGGKFDGSTDPGTSDLGARHPLFRSVVVPTATQGTYSGGSASASYVPYAGNTASNKPDPHYNFLLKALPPTGTRYNTLEDASGNGNTLSESKSSGTPGFFPLYLPVNATYGWGVTNASINGGLYPYVPSMGLSGDCTIVGAFRTAGTVTDVPVFLHSGGQLEFRTNSSDQWVLTYTDSGGGTHTLTSTATASTDTVYRFVIRRDINNHLILTINGTEVINGSAPAVGGSSGEFQMGFMGGDGHKIRVWQTDIGSTAEDFVTTRVFEEQGAESHAYFFEREFAWGQVILDTTDDITLLDGTEHTINGDWTSDDVPEQAEVVFIPSGIEQGVNQDDRDDIGSKNSDKRLSTVEVIASAKSTHDHGGGLNFGIYQFDGDGGDGTGDPVYVEGVKIAVDPTLGADGLPSNFAGERLPFKFGSEGAPRSLQPEITSYLSTDGNGVIEDGPHIVWVTSEAGASNSDGIGMVSFTPVIKFKETREE